MKRVPELDSLRALAAIVVIWSHAAMVAPAWRLAIVSQWGWTAVDLFFVISGYLITTIILRARESRHFLANFYVRRSLRIWPIYYLALLAFAALNVALRRPFPMDGLPYYLAYLQNVPHYWGAEGPPFCKAFAHCWSLAVEEQFYLIWPAVVLIAGRRRLVPLALGLMALAVVARGRGLDAQLLLTRCDGLALGGLLAALLDDPGPLRRHAATYRAAFGVAGACCVACLLAIRAPHLGGFDLARSGRLFACNLLYFCAVGGCVCLSGHPALGFLRGRALCYVGKISYGLYLYHNLIFGLLPRFTGLKDQPWTVMVPASAATFGLAALSWAYVERPFLALKDRFDYDRGPAADRRLPGVGLNRA